MRTHNLNMPNVKMPGAMLARNGLLNLLVIGVALLVLVLGAAAVSADFIAPGGGGSSVAAGCKNSCGNGYADAGEDCDTAIYGPYQSDICPDGSVRYKSCGSTCHWQYDPATCPVCGNGVAEGKEACDWGTENGVWKSTSVSCDSGLMSRQYTCATGCSKFVYDKECSKCPNSIWEPPEDCDWGPNGKEGAGATTKCPDGTVQRTDCSGGCKWVKVPPDCPPLFDCTKQGCSSDKVCNMQTKKCEPKPDTCTPQTTACDGNNVVTKQSCNKAGITTEKTISSVACKANEFCGVNGGTPQCLPDCAENGPNVKCSGWSAPQPGNICTRTCTSSDPRCTALPAQTTTSANGVPCTYHCNNGIPDAGEAGVDCGGGCPNACPITVSSCTPGTVNPGSHKCISTVCNQAAEKVCNSAGIAYDVTKTVTDTSCTSGCGGPGPEPCVPTTPCSTLGCGKTDSCGNSCGACPVPVVDPCANPDFSKSCCESKGFTWAKSGEGSSFGGFTTGLGQEGCVGDDSNEYLRFRECEAGVCSTDAGDVAACSSPYSCVYEGKCYTRLDKAAEEKPAVQQKISESKGKEDKLSKLLQKLEELHNKAKAATSLKERKETSKEIGSVMKDIDRAGGGIGEQSQGLVSKPGPGGTTATLLCTPPGA